MVMVLWFKTMVMQNHGWSLSPKLRRSTANEGGMCLIIKLLVSWLS